MRSARSVITMQTTTQIPADLSHATTLWARTSARIYDPFLWLSERRGLRARRGELLANARGLTLEIGSGTGLSLPHYPRQLDRLVLAEPDPAMRARLERQAKRLRPEASVIDAPAERLPFADGTVDTVVSMLVLCTVDAPELALREIARVLAPDGQLLFIEHIRAASRVRAFLQERLAAPWRTFANGCRCDQETVMMMAACGFQLDVSEAAWRGMPAIVKPLVYGCARHSEANPDRAAESARAVVAARSGAR
ncbi:MAG TPA: class I SAM-dependent methyltransferase [Solirubrobacteraceae bacterium]|nr:class I SAM-dependent methyltransferase [Solirubrobacteraceae bacterium]